MFKKFILKPIAYFLGLSIFYVILLRFVPVPITLTMVSEWMGTQKLYYDWVPMENISKEMPLAAVAAEDQLFPTHHGFDIAAIEKALERNKKGKKVRGASTISQQVAKNVFLWQGNSMISRWIRKGFEVYYTALIELIWGKRRILEVYINVAEMGPQTFGAEAAAQRYFKKPAAKLNRQEAAKIAAVLPSPKKWKVVNSGSYVNRRTNHIVRQMRALGGSTYLQNL